MFFVLSGYVTVIFFASGFYLGTVLCSCFVLIMLQIVVTLSRSGGEKL